MRVFMDECDYLIHLIRCAIHNQQPCELPQGLCFDRIYECGVYHHVANIAFYSVEKLTNKPADELYRKWQACRDRAVILDINQNYAAQEIRAALEGASIRFLEVQGTKLKPLYPHPEWRTMSDIDFIIDPENLQKAADLLKGLGYECEEKYGAEVDAHRRPNINIEMHSHYFLEEIEYREALRLPFETVEQTGQYDLNEFYLYNILHIARHYFYGGCGIRRVLDAYFLNKTFGEMLDRQYIQDALERVNAADFAAELSELADAWFGGAEQNVSRCKMAKYIILSGMHGTRSNATKKYLDQHYDSTARFGKLKYMFHRFAGSGGILRKAYPVLEQYKILYPFCWVHRAFCSLRPKMIKRFISEVKAVNKSDTMGK